MLKQRSLFKATDALQIPGWTTKRQHSFYKKIVCNLPNDPKVLELGCGYGRSTWAWLDILPSTASYYVVDSFLLGNHVLDKIAPHTDIPKHLSQREIFEKVIKQHKNLSIIKNIYKQRAEDWLHSKENHNNYDLIYLDNVVLKKLRTALSDKTIIQFLEKSKIFCGDDRWDEFYRQNNFNILYNLGIFFVIKNT